MAPLDQLLRRDFNPGISSGEFSDQWKRPSDIFSTLLILGGDVIGRALAQLTGSRVTPVAFSFGWVAYAVAAVVSAVGENKLMPAPDCGCKVINGSSGYVRDNTSWIIGRIVRDFEYWMDGGISEGPIHKKMEDMLLKRWREDKSKKEKKKAGSGKDVPRPSRAGLCVSIYKAEPATPGCPGYDLIYFAGFATCVVQLGIAAIPCAVYGDWGILLITTSGIILSFITGSLSQWSKEKWACRQNSGKKTILTRGNGSQHAIVVLGNGKGLDLEDLAAGPANADAVASYTTRNTMVVLAALWILLLITASGIQQNTWFLLAVGGIGMLQNIFAAGWKRSPKEFGIPFTFEKVIGEPKVMETLFAVEKDYPGVGRSMLDTFFPGKLRPDEEQRWAEFKNVEKGPISPKTI
ncbi:uncharacterized protein K452DRAFT_293164 [Aplosporella prunicola CBS 121167]|uniref:Uncharacterized protein n=1 Tax=Aplosporella prunicola CBS 121167 TaxID=1176127 RepID=A0A6A6AY93_9PEZI|nr:uncharacterized protein K452DRAFT_293164 [Aplosporella prunicola CBS 121167]KAF2135511.1 hypothetical protein K452DRAFT_293164 [Aplosporella prunicola CBS 121167]